MRLRQLRYAITVAEEKSFSQAAKKLYITQPSLSLSIQDIEKKIGVNLFDRTKTHFSITYAGEQFIKTARAILDLDSKLRSQIEDMGNLKSGCLTIGISLIRGSLLLPIVLPLFRKKFPGIRINIIEGTSKELEECIIKKIVDLIILTLPIENEQISFETLLTEEVLIAMPSGHSLYKKVKNRKIHKINFEDIYKEKLILLKPGSRLRQTIDNLFKRNGVKPCIVCESENMVTVHRLVAAGLGLTFIGSSIIHFDCFSNPPLYLSFNEPNFSRTLVVAYRKYDYISKAAREFITVLKDVLAINQVGSR